MSFESIVPYFVLMAVYLAVSTVFVTKNGFFSRVVAGSQGGRHECIEGLRGFLALGVFFTHGQTTLQYHQSGVWTYPASGFYTTLGEFSVALFFIITAFLFWEKVLRSDRPIGFKELYRSRNRRLTPMYLFSVLLVFLIVAVRTGFELRVEPLQLLYQTIAWLSFGFLGIPKLPDVNGLEDTFTILSVIWTLTFEWEFYLLLPIMARLPMKTVTMVAIMIAAYLAFPPAVVTLAFALGGLAAYLTVRFELHTRLKSRAYDLLMVGILACVLTQFSSGHGIAQYLLGFAFFFLVISKNDIFGILLTRQAKFLGAISYSIYLLHNIILNQVFFSVAAKYPIQDLSPTEFWFIVGFTGLLIIVASAYTFRFIEHPFIVKGRKTSAQHVTGHRSSKGSV